MSGPRVLVVDHHDSYTWNLVHLLAGATGELPHVVQHDEVTAEEVLRGGWTHVVLSPGPGHPGTPADFAVGREVLRRSRVPVLGVCLGMQGLVAAYGGRVAAVEPAHGEVVAVSHRGRGLFAGLPQGFAAVRYHSLAAVTVPEELVVEAWCDVGPAAGPGTGPGGGSAAGPRGRVVMGVRHRERPLWGVQFHPESVLTEHGGVLARRFLELP